MVIFTEAITHGTPPRTAPPERRHLLFKYSPGNSAWDGRPAVPEEVRPSLSERQRVLAEPAYDGGRPSILELSLIRATIDHINLSRTASEQGRAAAV